MQRYRVELILGMVFLALFGQFSAAETFDIGFDTGSPVSEFYQSPFRFTGTLSKIENDLASTKLGALEQKQNEKANRAVAAAAE